MDPAFQAHPVPQNVTNFEFHLVGDMTIKQFAYLAAGLGFAFLIFVTLGQPQPFLAWPIIVISAGVGAAFAFVPIQERPLDHWVAAFFRAIFKPTKLVYEAGMVQKDDPFFSRRLTMYQNTHEETAHILQPGLQSAMSSSGKKQSLADKIIANQDSIKTQLQKDQEIDTLISKQASQPPPSPVTPPQPITPQSASPQPMPAINPIPVAASPAPIPQSAVPQLQPEQKPSAQPEVIRASTTSNPLPQINKPPEEKEIKSQDLKKTVELAKEAQDTQAKIQQIETQLSQIKTTVAKPGADPKFYVDQFQSLLTDLQKLNSHASDLAHNLAVVSKTDQQILSTGAPTTAPAKIAPTVKLTSFPNVINGIVTDSQGGYVEGAIIVAHDKQGLPVRALKSNKLGQFVAATPLPNGVYTIVVEKENLLFDNVSVELKNDILQPVMLTAKKQQVIAGVAGTI